MKKRREMFLVSFTCAVLLLFFVFSGCGGGSNNPVTGGGGGTSTISGSFYDETSSAKNGITVNLESVTNGQTKTVQGVIEEEKSGRLKIENLQDIKAKKFAIVQTATITVSCTGGTAPYTYSYSASSGTVSGTGNTATYTASSTAGTYTINITATDAGGQTATGAANVQVQSVSTTTLKSYDFESGTLPSEMTVTKTGTFSSDPGIKALTNFGSTKAFGFGRTTCGANCYVNDNNMTKLKITLPSATYVNSISFKTMELFGNWGSYGTIFLDGAILTGVNPISDYYLFDRQPYNDGKADTTYRNVSFAIKKTVTTIELRVGDITSTSEIYIDDLVIN